jgi:carbon monoxide dehydrogenase subunit G
MVAGDDHPISASSVVKGFCLKIEGTHKVRAPRDCVFAALVDAAVLQKCIPGCEQMEKTGENQYNAKLRTGVGPIVGVFAATIALQDISAPEHYKLVLEGKGQPGFVKGAGELYLSQDGAETSILYTGDVNVGGLLASVGQRMIQGAASMMAGRFFGCLESEAKNLSKAPSPVS